MHIYFGWLDFLRLIVGIIWAFAEYFGYDLYNGYDSYGESIAYWVINVFYYVFPALWFFIAKSYHFGIFKTSHLVTRFATLYDWVEIKMSQPDEEIL